MKRSFFFHSIFAICLTGSLALTGCSGFSSIPDTQGQTPMGEIHGNVFGGHAPLVGARVFVLTPGTTGYGSKSTDLLSSSSTATASSYPVQLDTTGTVSSNPTYGMYYVTTDTTGSFGLSGDYTCTAGAPVYLYAYGGDQTAPTGTTFPITSAVAGTASGSPSIIPITVTTSAGGGFVNQYSYITVQGLTGTLAQFNGTSQFVTSVSGATFTFNVVDPAAGSSNHIANGTSFTGLSGSVSVLPGFNPATVNLLVLGDCPSSPSAQNFSSLHFIYVNEVATTAAAYALSGFTATAAGLTGTTDVNGTTINSAVYIGSPSASTQETTAIAKAALNAGQLYDIQGGNLTTVPYGEGHIARSSTPGIASGVPTNGVVPQALLDTLGNILAACVDSTNTWNPVYSSGGKSTQCWTNIFPTATSNPNGSGTAPTDIAMAMINISRFPAGPSSSSSASSTWVSKLFTTPGASVPFTPNLGTAQPNDFTVALNFYDNSGANLFLDAPSGIAIDSTGSAQIATGGAGDTGALTDLGTLGYIVGSAYETGVLGSGIAIGPSTTQYIWTANTQKTTAGPDTAGAFYISVDPVYSGNPSSERAYTDTSGTGGYYAALPSGTAQTQGIAIDGNGTAYIADTTNGIVHKLATPSTLPPPASNTSPAISVTSTNLNYSGCTTGANGLATSSSSTGSNLFVVSSAGNSFCEINALGTVTGTVSGLNKPTSVAVDNFGNAWVTDNGSNEVEALNYVSGALRFEVFTTSAGGLTAPYGIAFDGANNIWVANNGNNTVTELVSPLTGLLPSGFAGGVSITPLSPPTGYQPITGLSGSANYQITSPTAIAVDISGDVWVANTSTNTVTEIIGSATPVVAPIALGALDNKLASKP